MVSGGTVLGGRYKLDERIASGGMGDVWRGTDEVLGRTVAVKILLPALLEEPGFAERFRGEARTMATINHPGVVDVYDYGSEDGTAFLIMEYVEGDALSRTLGRVGRLTPGRTMALIAQAADALQAARRAAAALPTGTAGMTMPTSGGPSGTISGAPVSGGTRVMPGATAYQPNGPVSPAGRPGQYARGAASVPAPAPPSEQYTFA